MVVPDYVSLHGVLCAGLYFESGYCITLLSWDQSPLPFPSLSELWITGPEPGSTCYLDPPEAQDFFRFYHAFNRIVASRIVVTRDVPGCLSVRLAASAESLELDLAIGEPLPYRILNGILKTPAGAMLRSRGRTETGKAFLHEPHRLAAVRSARAVLNGNPLGSLTRPPEGLRVGGSPVRYPPAVSFCTHHLEAYQATVPGR